MFEPSRRVKVKLSGLTIKVVAFSQNVQEALGTIVKPVSAKPSVYLVELLFSSRASVPGGPRGSHPARIGGIHSNLSREGAPACRSASRPMSRRRGRFSRR